MMSSELERGLRVLRALAQAGVREICLCAGARNASFVAALEKVRDVKVWSFFEERSAAFFALGRTRALREPVAVLTTSGTAVAELLPAAIEAHYQQSPLILVTADRPRSFRGTGAPQAIEQSKLFQGHATWSADIEGDENFDLSTWFQTGPAHLNVCFADPVEEELEQTWNWPVHQPSIEERQTLSADEEISVRERVEDFFARSRKPLLILSHWDRQVPPGQEQGHHQNKDQISEDLEKVLSVWPGPIYAEATSGLRESPLCSDRLICSGERMVSHLLRKAECDGVVRLGAVPTLRAWRDLDESLAGLPVLSLSSASWSGLARDRKKALPPAALQLLPSFTEKLGFAESWLQDFHEKDHGLAAKLQKLMQELPRAEPSLLSALSERLVQGTQPLNSVFVGNSLPIREWDLVAQRGALLPVEANRGANGIDGQLSTFFGSASEWGVFGDLTALYDLSSAWILSQVSTVKHVVVINNGGGQIFRRKFSSPLFLNSHQLSFAEWAKMWKLDYHCWRDIPASLPPVEAAKARSDVPHHIFEIIPDEEQTEEFWRRWQALWN